MAWVDIRGAAGQQQSVESMQQFADIDLRTDRRYQDRQTACRLDHGARISLVHPVEGPLVYRAKAGGYADERQMAGGNHTWLRARTGDAKRRMDPDIQTASGRAPCRTVPVKATRLWFCPADRQSSTAEGPAAGR